MGKEVNELEVNHKENQKSPKKFELRNMKKILCVCTCVKCNTVPASDHLDYIWLCC